MFLKIFSILMLFIGETLCIYSEALVAKQPQWFWTFFLITLAGIPLLAGYHYGYQAFGSMWMVMAVSVASILVAEPITIWVMFKEYPSTQAKLSMAFGLVGLLIAMKE